MGASDFPACRKLGDCVTYVEHEHRPTIPQAGSAARPRGGASSRPGRCSCSMSTAEARAIESRHGGSGPHKVPVRVRVLSPVAPVETVQIVVNGRVVAEHATPSDKTQRAMVSRSSPISI